MKIIHNDYLKENENRFPLGCPLKCKNRGQINPKTCTCNCHGRWKGIDCSGTVTQKDFFFHYFAGLLPFVIVTFSIVRAKRRAEEGR